MSGLELKHAKRVVDRAIRPMRESLWLNNWTIHVEYVKLEPDVQGTCTADPRYMTATIKIDPTEIDDEERLLFVLRHELLHVVLAPYENFRQMAYKATATEAVDSVLDVGWHVAGEQTVRTLESILDWNECTPEYLAKR